MYYDLSLPLSNTIETSHLIRSLERSPYAAVALDHIFTDCPVTPPGEPFSKIQEVVNNSSHPVKIYSRATLAIEQTASLHQMNQVQNNGYDIMAVRPKT
jgi:hypothetical protein